MSSFTVEKKYCLNTTENSSHHDKKTIEPSIISDSSCVPIQRLHPSKAAFEDWMCHSSMTKTVPFQKLLKTQPWNAAFVSWALHTTNGSFMTQPQTMPRFIAHRLIFFLKRSSDAHFPHVDMILWGLKEKSNIHCLKCINSSVKKSSFSIQHKKSFFFCPCHLKC